MTIEYNFEDTIKLGKQCFRIDGYVHRDSLSYCYKANFFYQLVSKSGISLGDQKQHEIVLNGTGKNKMIEKIKHYLSSQANYSGPSKPIIDLGTNRREKKPKGKKTKQTLPSIPANYNSHKFW